MRTPATTMRRRTAAAAGLALAASLSMMSGGTAQAATAPYNDAAPDGTLTWDTSTVTDQLYDDTGANLVSTNTLKYDTSGPDLPEGFSSPFNDASGGGGVSSASGCRTVTVNNYHHTLLGFTAFEYSTSTKWCWNRATHTISNQAYGWQTSKIDPNEYWQGQTEVDTHWYAYHAGSPRSGLYHMRQGYFQNCILKYGCVGNHYPTNKIWSHANGTYNWSAGGTS